MRKRILAVLLLAASISASLAQQTVRSVVSNAEGLSLNDLMNSALAHNKDLEAARESIHQVEARLTQARLRPNPSVEASRTTDAMFGREGDTGLSVTLSQEIELGGKRTKRINVEEASIEVARSDIANAERQLRGRLITLYWEGLGAANKLDLLDRVDELNQQLSSVMTARLRAGDASRLDSQLLAGETNQVRAQRIAAENQLDGTLLQIRTLAGLSANEPLVLKRPQQTAEFAEGEPAALALALKNRPDLKAARLRESLEEAGVTLAKSQAVPNPTAFVRYGRESVPTVATVGGPRLFDRENVMEFGVSIPLPLFNRQKGSIAEATSRRVQARAEREALEVQIGQEVFLAVRRYQAAKRSMDVLQSGVLEPNQEGLRIIRLSYSLGDMRLLDVLNQQRVVLGVETSTIDAQTEFNSALAGLETAIGGR